MWEYLIVGGIAVWLLRPLWLAARSAMRGEPDPDEVDVRQRTRGDRAPGPCTIHIEYFDADGVVTERDIALYKRGHTNREMNAWCGLRREPRTFLFERVHRCSDIASGAPMTRPQLFKFVHPTRRVPDGLN